jgi:hypothetical protein
MQAVSQVGFDGTECNGPAKTANDEQATTIQTRSFAKFFICVPFGLRALHEPRELLFLLYQKSNQRSRIVGLLREPLARRWRWMCIALTRQSPSRIPLRARACATLVQSIRMVSCQGDNTWQQQTRQESIAAIGLDRHGRVLFLHARSPWSTHDFIDILRQLPLELAQAQYAEGGPEAQLFVRHGDREVELVGDFEGASRDSEGNREAWPVPNVIGVKKRGRPLP